MRATKPRATVGQDHLAASAAIIEKMAARKRRAKGETLDDIQRYAFVEMGGHLFALKARRGSRIGISCGGILYPVRVPKFPAERMAVLRAEAALPDTTPRKPSGTVALMAAKIVDAAARGVERRDFHQAGIADNLIDANFDAAMKMARRMEPRLDAMVAA